MHLSYNDTVVCFFAQSQNNNKLILIKNNYTVIKTNSSGSPQKKGNKSKQMSQIDCPFLSTSVRRQLVRKFYASTPAF